MKAMMAYATPGEIHKLLAKSVGTWTTDITMWMQPGTPPTTATGETKNEMILGGRYLQATNTSVFMGQPFQGIGLLGFDNIKKIFVNSWVDNMGTGMMFLTGTWDDKTKSINFTGPMTDPTSGKDIPVREVVTFVNDNTQVMDMYISAGGKEFKTMEIKYTRKL
jgi:hypothetical protein